MLIKTFRILFSLLVVFIFLFPCLLPAFAYELEPGELPDSTEKTYSDDLPVFLVETGITITSQPVDYFGQIGDTATFTVVATGEITSYQWQFRSPNSTLWKDCTSNTPGFNSNKITPTINDSRNGQSYRCVIKNSLGYVVSNVATLHVGVPPETEPPETEPPETDPPVSDSASVSGYLEWFLSFVRQGIDWMGAQYIVGGVSLLHFIIAVGVICIVVGGILIR